MRQLLILFFAFPLCLFAQQESVDVFAKGWYLSFSAGVEVDDKFSVTPYVTASDTLLRTGVITSFLPRRPDTVLLNGIERIYFEEPGLRQNARRQQALANFIGSIRAHYRNNDRLEFSFGLYYRPTHDDVPRMDDPSGLPNDFFYRSNGVTQTAGGLIGDFTYHLRKGKRLRPYCGILLLFGIEHQEALNIARVFPGLNEEIDLTEDIIERFRTNTIIVGDVELVGGINYQIDDRLAVGLEARFGDKLFPLPLALQFRYRLKKSEGKTR